jgi:hypothetical protein
MKVSTKAITAGLFAIAVAVACTSDPYETTERSQLPDGNRDLSSIDARQHGSDPLAQAQEATGTLVVEDETMGSFTLVDPSGPGAAAIEDRTLHAPVGTNLAEFDGEEVTVSLDDSGNVVDIQRASGPA